MVPRAPLDWLEQLEDLETPDARVLVELMDSPDPAASPVQMVRPAPQAFQEQLETAVEPDLLEKVE